MVEEIAKILYFSILGKNLKIQNDHHFWKFFWKVVIHKYFWTTLEVENFDEIALSRTVKEIWAILCLRTFASAKIQNGRHFLNFLEKLSYTS